MVSGVPVRVYPSFFSLLALCLLVACGRATPPVAQPAQAVAGRVHAAGACSQPDTNTLALLSGKIEMSGRLTIGTASSPSIEFIGTGEAPDGAVHPLRGLDEPLTLKLQDPGHHVTISCTVMYDALKGPTLSFDGHGDRFAILMTYKGSSFSANFVANLEKDTPLSTQSSAIQAAHLRVGSDGNLWSPVIGNQVTVIIARIEGNGRTRLFVDPISRHRQDQSSEERAILGPDGNMWMPFESTDENASGFDRVDPSGRFTAFPFAGYEALDDVTGMVNGPHGTIYLGLLNGVPSRNGIGAIDMRGKLRFIATTKDTPGNLIIGPDHNLWFTLRTTRDTRIARMTGDGKVRSYPIACSGGIQNEGPFSFVVGPDRLFWETYPCGALKLVKFDTAGKIVYDKPLAYPQLGLVAGPNIADWASDAKGNLWGADEGGDGTAYGVSGLLRIDRQGAVTELPTFQPIGGEPTSLAYDEIDGKLYLSNEYIVPNKLSEGSIIAVDPKFF